MHILILGGTSEASALTGLIAQQHLPATLSLAGRTRAPQLPPIPYRIGGFGGIEGLAAWMRERQVTALVDATHPFARVMPFHAAEAAAMAHIPLLALRRPEWTPETGDHWIQVTNHDEVIAALGPHPRRVFLTVGRLELAAYASAPQHFYLTRSIDPVEDKPLANAQWLTARGPFTVEAERALLSAHAIDCVVTKNSGGHATQAKLAAARELGLPVIMITRPPKPMAEHVTAADAALGWLRRVHGLSP